MKRFSIYLMLLIFPLGLQAQYYTLGHEQMVDPVVATKQKYNNIDVLGLSGNDLWDKTNFNSFSVLVFDKETPVHEIVYQTDSWGNLSYFGVASGLLEIMQTSIFPKIRFQMEAKKTAVLFEGKERVRALLQLLVSVLNELSF